MQQCRTMGKDYQEMIKFFILYILVCWKDNLKHLIIIYKIWPTTICKQIL